MMCMLLDETTALEKAVPADKLRAMLQTQLEYYFSAWVLSLLSHCVNPLNWIFNICGIVGYLVCLILFDLYTGMKYGKL